MHRRTSSLRAAATAGLLFLLAACGSTDTAAPFDPSEGAHSIASRLNTTQAVNLIRNPGLETSGPGAQPVDWSRQFWGTAPTFTYPATGRTGRGAQVTQRVNSTGDARWQHAAVPVTAGARYTYSIWYRSTTATSIVVAYTGANGTMSFAQLASMGSSRSRWVQQSATFTVPAGVVQATIYVAISRAGSVTIDDASLTAVDVPLPDPFPQGIVSLTFDDAWESQYDNALPILEAAGLKATFYLTSVPIEQRWRLFMTPAEVQDIAAKGHEIGGHTLLHPNLAAISLDSVRTEVTASRTYLQNLTGRPVTSFAYPFGINTPAIQAIVAGAGYSSARGVEFPPQNVRTTNRYALYSMCIDPNNTAAAVRAQIDLAMANRTWLILCFHDVKDGGDNISITPADLQSIVDHLRARGTRVVTVAEGRALMGP